MASADTAAIVPPQNLEAEESVLGAMMVSEAAVEPVILDVRLRPDDFYAPRHLTIFRTILELRESDGAVDVLTVTEALAQRGELDAVGGRDRVASLAARVPAAGNARHYARIVKQNALMRRLDAAAKTIQQSVAERDGQPNELVENAERLLFQVAHEERAADFKSLEDVLHTEWDRLQLLHENKTELIGTPSGFKELDERTGGFQKNNLVVIAARPSMGKSALVCNIAENAALKHGKTIALFSLEMSESELAQRFLASQARISSDRLRKGTVSKSDWPKVVEANNRLAEAPLWIDDSSDLGLLELRAKARRLAAQEHGAGRELGLIIVDYIQLIRADDPRANRVEQVGQFSRGLKLLSGELGVPVIGVSQLSRAPEQRPDKRPILSDLRESGCLTADSRVWLPDEGRYAPIGDLAGQSGFRVLALNPETCRFERRRVSNAFATGTKPVFRLTTAMGRTIRATANHKFLTGEGWRRLDELKPGEHLALPNHLEGEAPEPMAPEEASLLGLVVGDGLPRHAVQLTARVRNTAQLAARLASDLFADRLLSRVDRERRWYQVYLAARGRLTDRVRNPAAEWLEQLGGLALRSAERRVPDRVFAQSEDVIASFLRHLWAAEGCVWLDREDDHRPRIYYATPSAPLARDVQSLLLRIGITATQRRVSLARGRWGFQVEVSGGPDMHRFLCVVGDLDPDQQTELEEVLEYLEAQPAAEPSPRQISAPSARRRVAAGAGAPELAAPVEGEVYWDRIRSIEPDGVEEVFDLTVPGLHNFVADDIVVHNSIEQDADLVMFLYRDEYYNPESEDQGIAELHLAKHRNGPIGTVKLVFLSHYPKFANLTRTQPPVEQSSSDGSSLPDIPDVDEPDAAEEG